MDNISRRTLLHRSFTIVAALGLGAIALAADNPSNANTDILKPGGQRPADAVVLFDGKDTSKWEPVGKTMWPVEDGTLVDTDNDIQTKDKFKDFQLHLEFNEPKLGPEFKGQDRGNSGVYLQGRYELQVLDSYHNDTYADGGCAAIYSISHR